MKVSRIFRGWRVFLLISLWVCSRILLSNSNHLYSSNSNNCRNLRWRKRNCNLKKILIILVRNRMRWPIMDIKGWGKVKKRGLGSVVSMWGAVIIIWSIGVVITIIIWIIIIGRIVLYTVFLMRRLGKDILFSGGGRWLRDRVRGMMRRFLRL